jgi:uncharacterized protein (TIGR00251 family)
MPERQNPDSADTAPSLDLREQDGVLTLRVRVQPRASRESIAGLRQGALMVRLTAPPVEGEANAALQRFLGKALGLPPSSVELLRGTRGRDKLVRLSGTTTAAVRNRLQALWPALKP